MSKTNTNRPSKILPNNRYDYSKISGTLALPNLVEIQTDSYRWFLAEGIEEVMHDFFPIKNSAENVEIAFINLRFDEPKYTHLDCKIRDLTYSAPLKATFRLTIRNNQTGGEIIAPAEQEVFMGDLPLMTDSGTFVVNGAERVIVSQIVRSPGAYMTRLMDPKSGKWLYEGDLIPTRGTWLEFKSDAKDIINVSIDRQRKMHASIFLKALGLTNETLILDLFDTKPVRKGKKKTATDRPDEELTPLELTLRKDANTQSSLEALYTIFTKLKPGEPATNEGVINFLKQKFFDRKRYDLGRAGRYKFAKKLGVYNRLINRYLAAPLASVDGDIVFDEGTLMTKAIVDQLKADRFFEKGAHARKIEVNRDLDVHNVVTVVSVYTNEKRNRMVNIVGTDLNLVEPYVTIPDILATFSYFMNVHEGVGNTDDIDHLGNRRVRCVGELIQNQFRIGLTKMAKAIKEKMSISETSGMTPKNLVNIRPLTSAIKEFFASSQLSQFMDKTNPLAELTNKRRISALGPGGLTRDRASFEVRDVHYSHYGRICPIETPEGQNIGLINNLASYAKVNKYGFLETPYRKLDPKTHKVTEVTEYLSADQERDVTIAQANVRLTPDGLIADEEVIARHDGENILTSPEKVDYIDVSPKQIVSIAAASIPFLENDDAMRALMGANMQRQALPLLRPTSPLVGTGLEHLVAHDSGSAVIAHAEGVVTYVDARKVVVTASDEVEHKYLLQKFSRSNQGTCFNQIPIVKLGEHIKAGQIIADGPAMENGDLALGQNVTIAFMTWNGYNYEDAVIMSERLVKDDVYTSIHIEEYEVKCRDTKLGKELITRDIPNIGEEAKRFLDSRGVIITGAEVKEGDILVGKTTPKGQSEPSPVDKLMAAIAGDKSKDGKDTSLRVPHGGAGIVVDVKIFTRKNKDELQTGVDEVVRVYIAQKRKISEGDKMSGRHGNKGVISRILPVEDMPFLPDGTPVDIMLNPLGVPSRMNIGQILELHLGFACQKLGIKIATPVFDGMSNEELFGLMKEAGLPRDGKTILFDGRSGERFDERISVGVMYMIKLVHMVDDKLHARSTGPYSLVTQQPLGGKAQNGGQRFGEMEVWALEAYGAAHTLQEILTIKSDDVVGRNKTNLSIIKGEPLPKPSIPESFKVLTRELQGLSMNVELIDSDGAVIDLNQIAKDNIEEERKLRRAIREPERLEESVEILAAQASEELAIHGDSDSSSGELTD